MSAKLNQYQRRDNALFIPEMGNAPHFARYIDEILGRGAIGVAAFGKIFAAFRPMEQLWAKWAFEGPTYGMAESDARTPQTLGMKNWNVTASFREWQMGSLEWSSNKQDFAPNTEFPTGGAAFAQIGEDEFIVIGQQIRLHFGGAGANAGKPAMYLRVEEGRFDASGKWLMERNWNGDQVDAGLNLPARPTVLKVRMGTD